MEVEDTPDTTNPLDDRLVYHGRWMLAVLCIAGGVARAFWPTGVDWQSLLFLAMAGGLLMLPYLKEFSFSNKGGKLVFATRKDMKTAIRFGIGGKTKAAGESTPGKTNLLTNTTDEDDPQKGKWSGQAERNGYRISAKVDKITGSPDWFRVTLKVDETRELSKTQAKGEKVRFHLHPSFRESKADVLLHQGEAEFELIAWGGFTVGAEVFDPTGKCMTTLELNLARIPGVPRAFAEN